MAHSPRRAFTLVEVLVALLLLAVAVNALAAGIAADRRLRLAAMRREDAAERLQQRLEQLAARCGTADTAATEVGAWGTEVWSARSGTAKWTVRDTVHSATGRALRAVNAVVWCRE